MTTPPRSDRTAKELAILYRELDGCRKALLPYQGVLEDALSKRDKGMIRYYEGLKRRTLDKIEELENGSSGAA